VDRKEKPVAFVASVLIHLMILFAVARWLDRPRPVPEMAPEAPPEPIARLVFPPAAALRPPAPPAQSRPAPAANPPERPQPPPEAKDRISIGAPSNLRQKTPLELRRDEDLTRTIARGRPDATGVPASPVPDARPTATPRPSPRVAAVAPEPEPEVAEPQADTAAEVAEAPLAPAPRPVGPPAASGPTSIAESLRSLDERLAGQAARGLESGTFQRVGTSPLLFDPQGADFTAWTNHFKNEVYRNWIVPPSVSMGIRGHVDLEFRVERDGTMSAIRIIRSSGTPALDRAASNALRGSRFLPLPDDFRPSQVVIQVSFFYNEPGSSS
jgi:periplasmic protein TonB